jgi:hypothetical protein
MISLHGIAGTHAPQGFIVCGVSWVWQCADGIWLDSDSGAPLLTIRGVTFIRQTATSVSQTSPLC